MTHFTVGIIIRPDEPDVESYIARQMEPYYEDTDNPDSKWDWYRVGGRWDGWITGNEQSSDGGFNFGGQHETLENNTATTEHVLATSKIPHAIIPPDGRWYERGQMGWFGVLLSDNDGWDAEAREILAAYPAYRVVLLDAHI